MTEKQSLSIYTRCALSADRRYAERTKWGMTEERALQLWELDKQAAWLRHLERVRGDGLVMARMRYEMFRKAV